MYLWSDSTIIQLCIDRYFMRIREIKYTIVEQGLDYFIRIDEYWLGIHMISEVLTETLSSKIEVFGSREQCEERISELTGGKKSIKKKLKLFRRC